MAEKKADIGLIGLAVMGQNLVLNMCDHGYTVAVYNRTTSKMHDFVNSEAARGKSIIPCETLEELVQAIKPPRPVMIMVKAGWPVDAQIESLVPILDQGDILIDGGNSHFPDTIRRNKDLQEKGLLFVGTGVSGGEEGARYGPSIMPGGQKDAYERVEKIFLDISAKVDGDPCCTYIGDDGAGHYVKMVHNGIEYGDMQFISEAYFIMRHVLGMEYPEMQKVFAEWNSGDLDSYLMEISADILSKTDPDTGKPMLEIILDRAGQKGTGKWTSQSALDLGIPAPTIAEAVFARCISAIKDERVEAARLLEGPKETAFTGDRDAFVAAIKDALYASKICSYAQGFALMAEAAREYGWTLNFGEIAMIWRGGCIIRAHFLQRIKDAYDKNPDLKNLLLDPYFKEIVHGAQENWRTVVATATKLGVPVPAFSSALAYYDGYRTPTLWANMIQAQRDYFGAHTYERTDKDGDFHTDWPNA
jgi:6-phosphogluconate dehydrogenase